MPLAKLRLRIFKGLVLFGFSFLCFSCSMAHRPLASNGPSLPDASDTNIHERGSGDDKKLEQNWADLKFELVQRDKRLNTLEEKVRRLEQNVESLESKGTIEKSEPAQPSRKYQKTRELLLKGDALSAARGFETFAKDYPDHSLADNALYWLGECYYFLGQYKKAVQEFSRLIKTYPKAEKVPDALLKIGYAYLSMDDMKQTDFFLKQVLKKYPFSPAADKAQEKLKTIAP